MAAGDNGGWKMDDLAEHGLGVAHHAADTLANGPGDLQCGYASLERLWGDDHLHSRVWTPLPTGQGDYIPSRYLLPPR